MVADNQDIGSRLSALPKLSHLSAGGRAGSCGPRRGDDARGAGASGRAATGPAPSVGFQVKCATRRCEKGRCSTRAARIVPETLRRSCRKSHKPCADPPRWGERGGACRGGDTGVGEPDEARKEHAVSDRRRVSGTIRAALMDNGATHLESYIWTMEDVLRYRVLPAETLPSPPQKDDIGRTRTARREHAKTPLTEVAA